MEDCFCYAVKEKAQEMTVAELHKNLLLAIPAGVSVYLSAKPQSPHAISNSECEHAALVRVST
jgi:hypothetical protein